MAAENGSSAGGWQGMPLKDLSIRNSRVDDLSPLADMPLEWLLLTGAPAGKKRLPDWQQEKARKGECYVEWK